MTEDATRFGEADIRGDLPHTWHAFFGRFGRLRAVQRQAVPPLVRGDNVLVAAPTAAGKTEAVLAPLLERCLAGAKRASVGLAVVVVSPTRALCNDLLRRVRGPVGAVGLTVDIKTGDAPSLSVKAPPNLLITTPESLDSLVCRHPRMLRGVRAVMLDEVHLLDGTARGDQVRCLLARLDRIVCAPLQRCGASATVPDIAATARRFLGAEASWVIAQAPPEERRRIAARAVEAVDVPGVADHILALFDEAPRRKVLVFANRRADVESLVAEIGDRPRLAGRVFAHHGSLARGERLRVERRFLDAPAAICVATSTLEIGIDIGDVDRVVLLGPPPNVSALLQRVGRGNRKQAVAHALCLYGSRFEAQRFEHLIECAGEQRLFAESVTFRPAVVAQQALSLLFQSQGGWVSAAALRARLPLSERDRFSEADCGAILDGLVAEGALRRVQRGRYVADVEGRHAFEYGRVHSNLADSPELEVVDELTGRKLGSVAFGRRQRDAARAGADVGLALAGRRLTVARVEERRLVVRSDDSLDETQFIAKQAPRYSRQLAGSLGAHLGLEAGTFLVQRLGPDQWRLDHFLGTVWGRLLGGLLKRWGLQRRVRGGPFRVALEAQPSEALFRDRGRLRRDLDAAIEADLKRLARLYSPGPFGSAVPRELTRDWVTDNVNPSELANTLCEVRLVEAVPADRAA